MSIAFALESGATRSVAALIHFTKLLPNIQTEFSKNSVAQELLTLPRRGRLTLRKLWHGFDSPPWDEELRDKVMNMLVAEDKAGKLYEAIRQNPAAAIAKAREQFLDDDDLREELTTNGTAFITINLMKAKHPHAAIRTGVPFPHLQKLLLRAHRMTESSGKIIMTDIRIAHSPILSNNAPVRELLAYE